MFDFLKKKIASFTEKIVGKAKGQKKTAEAKIEEEKTKLEEIPETKTKEEIPEPEELEETEGLPEKEQEKELSEEEELTEDERIALKEIEEADRKKKEAKIKKEKTEIRIETPKEKKKIEIQIKEKKTEKEIQIQKQEIQASIPSFDSAGEKAGAEETASTLKIDDRKELKAKVSLGKQIFGLFTGKVKLEEKDLKDILYEFELALLESDVNLETAEKIVEILKEKISGKEIPRGKENDFVKETIRETLEEVMETERADFFELIESKKPFIILMLGLNGAGKTTSIAKLTHLLQEKGKTVLWASSDTFRAGAIEQLEEHAKKLNVNLIKHKYGADPTAVAFDAVKSAEAKDIDVLLIDTAGRQDTNKNLLEELKKMDRVIKPDLKIYVGEAFTGQALITQVKEFNSKIPLDGFILTKIDSDSKGGTAISLLHELRKPIYFVGTGQRYEDLIEFRKEFIIKRII